MDYDTVMTVEGAEGHEADSELDFAISVQRMINDGNWSLQGSFGRTMMSMIEGGKCMLGMRIVTDYWGNLIPARTAVVPGTMGSPEFVEERMGAEWREAIENA